MSKSEKDSGMTIVSQNKKASHDYLIVSRIEAGIVLTGGEVKSVRAGSINLRDSYVRVKNGEAFLLNCHIQPYKFAAMTEEKDIRERKLLLHRKEIDKMQIEITHKGNSVIPTKAYFKQGKCKIELGIGKGKKHHDKRDSIKKREADRAIARVMKRR